MYKNLFNLTEKEKKDYLEKFIYENIKESDAGTLAISTSNSKKVAELLGGNYDDLSVIGKKIFKNSIISENININNGFSDFLKY